MVENAKLYVELVLKKAANKCTLVDVLTHKAMCKGVIEFTVDSADITEKAELLAWWDNKSKEFDKLNRNLLTK